MRDFRFWRWAKDHDDDVDREIDVHLALEVDDQLDGYIERPRRSW